MIKKLLIKKTFPVYLFLITALIPLVSYAQPKDFKGFVKLILDIISSAAPLVVFISFIVFFWGLTVFILNSGEEEKRKKGKVLMVWGIIALTVAVSIWGIIAVLISSIFGSGFDFVVPRLRGR